MIKTPVIHKDYATGVSPDGTKYKLAVCGVKSTENALMDGSTVTCPSCNHGIKELLRTGGN